VQTGEQIGLAISCTGQRVQLSVFECSVNDAQMEILRTRRLETIDTGEDSLRIYRLHGNRKDTVEAYGRDDYTDFREPLVV
jgi:CRISPR-associated protein Cas2